MPYDVDTITALGGRGIIVRDLLTVQGKTLGGSAAEFNYWTGKANVAINVLPLGEETPVSRNFVGGGTLLDVPAIVDAVGLEARAITFGLDHLSTVTGSPMDMVYGNNVRVARVELHRALFDPETWNLVATPVLMFAGRVDGAAVDDAAVDGEGGLSIEAQSSAIDLTRKSMAMESDEQQRLRSGDRFRRYSDTAGQVDRWWGRAQGS